MNSYFCSAELWSEESMNKYCPNLKTSEHVSNQYECQAKCEAEESCVGISYVDNDQLQSNAHSGHGCFVCNDDTLVYGSGGYGFYRRPIRKS